MRYLPSPKQIEPGLHLFWGVASLFLAADLDDSAEWGAWETVPRGTGVQNYRWCDFIEDTEMKMRLTRSLRGNELGGSSYRLVETVGSLMKAMGASQRADGVLFAWECNEPFAREQEAILMLDEFALVKGCPLVLCTNSLPALWALESSSRKWLPGPEGKLARLSGMSSESLRKSGLFSLLRTPVGDHSSALVCAASADTLPPPAVPDPRE